jgi:hypothetical protein
MVPATAREVDTSAYECPGAVGRQVAQDADALLDGVVGIGDHDAVDLGEDIDWSSDPYENRNWRFHFHGMQYLHNLFTQPGGTRNRSGTTTGPGGSSATGCGTTPATIPFGLLLDLHATALRADVLACAAVTLGNEEWLMEGLELHGRALADPAYAGPWNHGLDQDIALLSTGCVLGRDAWVRLAEERSSAAAAATIDEQGVSNEQSVGYHYYNYERYGELQTRLQRCGREPSPALGRRERMPGFLAHATMPNGEYAPIGDTLRQPAAPIPGTVAEFAATLGAPDPDRKIGWPSTTRGMSSAGAAGEGSARSRRRRLYSLRFGPGRIIYGHNDHTALTYHSHGRPLLMNRGSGLPAERVPGLPRSPAAHYVVMVDDGSNFFWDEETRLVDRRIEEHSQYFDLLDRPYSGVTRRRGVLVVEDPAFLIVRDNLSLHDPAPSNSSGTCPRNSG